MALTFIHKKIQLNNYNNKLKLVASEDLEFKTS